MNKLLKCGNCKVAKDSTYFHKNKYRSSGHSYLCIICDTERKKIYSKTEKGKAASSKRGKRWRDNNKSKVAKIQAKTKDKKRKVVEEYKITGCSICGYNKHPSVLDLHHLDPNKKENSISDIMCSGGMDSLLEEIKKCIILCANCHREYHCGLITLNNKLN